jgi:hypothetical protein
MNMEIAPRVLSEVFAKEDGVVGSNSASGIVERRN